MLVTFHNPINSINQPIDNTENPLNQRLLNFARNFDPKQEDPKQQLEKSFPGERIEDLIKTLKDLLRTSSVELKPAIGKVLCFIDLD